MYLRYPNKSELKKLYFTFLEIVEDSWRVVKKTSLISYVIRVKRLHLLSPTPRMLELSPLYS